MKKLLFIYNIHAGTGRIRDHLADVLESFAEVGFQTTVHPTQGPKDATETVAAYGKQYDQIVCCGGDGTLNEVITGLLALEEPPVLGYIPAGTTNDFSKNLNLPSDIVRAADCAVHGTPLACDVGMFNDLPFVYVAAFGAFTDVSYNTSQELKNVLGHAAYLLSGISKLSSLKSYRMKVTYEGGVLEDEFIFGMVSNTVSVGGFRGLPTGSVELDDGLFECLLVKTPRSLPELNSIVQAMIEQKPNGNVYGFHSARLTFESEEAIPWTLDGEYGGDRAFVTVENLHQAVTIMRP